MPDLTVEELGQLVRGTAAATWSFSNEGVSLQTAPWMELTGQTAEQMAGEGWLNVVNPADRDRVAAAWATSISHEQHFNTDYRILCADNVYRWFNVRGIPLRSAEGDVERWVGVLLEIPGTARFRDKVPTNIAASGDLSLTLRPAQLRAARASLNWSAVELAKRCGVSVSTIRRFEQEAHGSRLHGRSAVRIGDCLREAGVRMTIEADGSLGLTWSD